MPLREQIGPLMLQRRSLTVSGAWKPNWLFDALCVAPPGAEKIESLFDVELRPIAWPTPRMSDPAFQIIIPVVGERWYDPAELDAACQARHGAPGKRCPKCQTWRWYGIDAPPPRFFDIHSDVAIALSPEVFGDGCAAFRKTLVRRDLAALLTSAGHQDLGVRELNL